MRFCPDCQRVMTRDTSSGRIIFRCTSCGKEVEGSAADRRIGGRVLHAGETADKYRSIIRNAPKDRTNQLVKAVCPKCNLDYMTQLRIGDREVVVLRCKCGYEVRP